MKRRVCGLVLVWILTMVMILGTASAATNEINGALDLVILLDNSGSMYGDNGNDRLSYRYDAASIMLNMCEVTGSRAVVYEFSGGDRGVKSVTKAAKGLQSIDVDKSNYLSINSYRTQLTDALTQRAKETYKMEHEGGTPLGAALAQAVSVLEASADDRNGRQPLILVLADGDDNSEESIRREALIKCRENGYKIYTILLGNDIAHVDTLQQMAALTGGTYFELEDATELPKYFSQVLADQTGAELTSEKMEAEQLEDGRWQVVINVPNRSVQEGNIMIPAMGLSNITLTRPNGTVVRPATDEKIYYFEVGGTSLNAARSQTRFVQYKIMQPNDEGTELGKWLLTFNAEDEAAARQVSVTVVYNYDLPLKTSADDQVITAGKDEKVTLDAAFYTSDGTPSEDDMLYRSSESDPAIVCKAYLVNDPDTALLDESRCIVMTADRIARKFTATFSLRDFPNITSRSGNYYIVVKAEGDGLIRSSKVITYTVTNHAPQAQKVPEVALTIQDPVKGMDQADVAELKLSDCVIDPDAFADIDLNSIELACDDSEIVRAELVNQDGDEQSVMVRLTSQGKAGSTTVRMSVRDIENETAVVEIPVVVRSLMDSLDGEYELKLADANADGQKIYQRGETVVLTSEYLPRVAAPTYDIDQYMPQIKIQQVNEDGTRRVLDNSTVTLEGRGGDYLYEAVLYVNGEALKTTELRLSTGNVAPMAKEDAIWTPDKASVGCEKLPDVWMGHQNTEPWTVLFADQFTDGNAADTLTYTYTVEGQAAEIAEVQENGVLIGLTITPVAEGKTILTLTATDDSSEMASCTMDYTVEVYDQNKVTVRQLLVILVILVLLFIVYQIIHAVTRPKFQNVAMQVSVNGIPQKTYPLSASIKKASMSRYTLPSHQFTGLMAGGLELKPSRDGAIITVKKPAQLRGAELRLNGSKLNGKVKKVALKRNVNEFSVTLNGEAMGWKIIPAAKTTTYSAARKR